MATRFLELEPDERAALMAFGRLVLPHQDDIATAVMADLHDAEELGALDVEGAVDDFIAERVRGKLQALAEDPGGAYLDALVAKAIEGAGRGIPYASLVVTNMALTRVLVRKHIELQSDEQSRELVRDALLRLSDIDLVSTAEAYLEGKEQTIGAQQEAMLALSVPVIEVADGVLVLPLIGTIDTDRARRITLNLLKGMREKQTRVVILDISGVPLVDTGIANHLIKTLSAARLLGAQGMIVGISPQIASTLVSLDIDFGEIQTYYSLRDALEAHSRA